MFEGMYYVLRVGCAWRDLPVEFGSWQSVYTRYGRWNQSGLWNRILASLPKAQFGKCRSVDCSHVKVHRDGANPVGGQLQQAMGRTKGGLNTKIAAVVDALGRVVGLHLMPGNHADLKACEVFFDQLRGHWVLADKAFDCAALRHKLAKAGCRVNIPPRAKRSTQYYYSKELYKLRHTVENFFCRIKYYKRVFTRFDKLADSYLGFVSIAAIIDWLNFLV